MSEGECIPVIPLMSSFRRSSIVIVFSFSRGCVMFYKMVWSVVFGVLAGCIK